MNLSKLVPPGYVLRDDALEQIGRALCGDDWKGDELDPPPTRLEPIHPPAPPSSTGRPHADFFQACDRYEEERISHAARAATRREEIKAANAADAARQERSARAISALTQAAYAGTLITAQGPGKPRPVSQWDWGLTRTRQGALDAERFDQLMLDDYVYVEAASLRSFLDALASPVESDANPSPRVKLTDLNNDLVGRCVARIEEAGRTVTVEGVAIEVLREIEGELAAKDARRIRSVRTSLTNLGHNSKALERFRKR